MAEMYIPKPFKETDPEELDRFIAQYNFATLITHSPECISAVPILQVSRTVLEFHLAHRNPHDDFIDGREAVFLFLGPHSYITPTWYAVDSVPTWNYALVKVEGIVRRLDEDGLISHLDALVEKHEAERETPWSRSSISEKLDRAERSHITGYAMEVSDRIGKFKLGQNRSKKDRLGVIEGLEAAKTPDSAAMLEMLDFAFPSLRSEKQ